MKKFTVLLAPLLGLSLMGALSSMRTGTLATNVNGSGTLNFNSSGTITVPNLTDTLVTLAGSQTLTNKTLTSPTLTTPTTNVHLLTEQSSTPSTPSAGTKKFYAKNDGKVYTLNSSGQEVEVGSGGGSGFNLFYNGNFDSNDGTSDGYTEDSSGIVSYISGTVGAGPLSDGNVRINATSSGQIVYFKMKPNPVGMAFSNCEAKFRYRSDDTLYKVYVYDSTNSKKVSAEYTVQSSSIGGAFLLPIPFRCGDALVENKLAVESTSSSAGNFDVDELVAGEPTATVDGPIVTPWVDSGTITLGGTTSAPTKATTTVVDKVWTRRNGPDLEVRMEYKHSSNSGANNGSGDYLPTLPSSAGCVIDTSKVTAFSTAGNVHAPNNVGTAWVTNGSTTGDGVVTVYDSTHVRVHYVDSAGGIWGSGNYAFTSSALTFNLTFSVPCQGWSTGTSIRADQTNYGWTSYTPTFTGFGTVTNVDCKHKRDGEDLLIDCKFTTGTRTATEARVSFPGSLVAVTTTGSPRICGSWGSTATGVAGLATLCESAVSYVTFGLQTAAAAALSKQNGNSISGDSTATSFIARIRINGWIDNGKAPQLYNSDICDNYNGVCKRYIARFTNNGSTCVTAISSNSSVTVARQGTGICRATFPSGYDTSKMVCTANPKTANSSATAYTIHVDPVTSTAFDFTNRRRDDSAIDLDMFVDCTLLN